MVSGAGGSARVLPAVPAPRNEAQCSTPLWFARQLSGVCLAEARAWGRCTTWPRPPAAGRCSHTCRSLSGTSTSATARRRSRKVRGAGGIVSCRPRISWHLAHMQQGRLPDWRRLLQAAARGRWTSPGSAGGSSTETWRWCCTRPAQTTPWPQSPRCGGGLRRTQPLPTATPPTGARAHGMQVNGRASAPPPCPPTKPTSTPQPARVRPACRWTGASAPSRHRCR